MWAMWVAAASCWKKNKDSLFSVPKFLKTCGRICSVQLSKFTVKKENGYDYSWYTASTPYSTFNVTHQRLVYLCGQWSKTMLHLQKTLALDWLNHFTLPLKCTLAMQSTSGSSCRTINLYGFKHSNFVVACTDDFDTLVSWDNHLKIFVEMLPPALQIIWCFYWKTMLCCLISSLTRHLMIAVCSAVNILLILTGIKHWETNF